MKKTQILIIALLTFSLFTTAYSQFQVEKHYIGPRLGLSFLGSTISFGADYEYGMRMEFGNVGIGGIFRYWAYDEGWWSYTNILFGVQGNYHFKLDNQILDPWAGLVLAYDVGTWDYKGVKDYWWREPSYGGLWLGLVGGLRYWISPTMALVGRIGFGTLSYGALEIGVDFKL
ncbi:MAG: hypothetical protein N3A61_07510 [Ignavibacteria bacterium]|nr:hypothetical protein [Ignavibacteria bacterium]